jgi:hypothetical protein
MRTLIEVVAAVAILANAINFGTDVFGAIVQRPEIAAVDDRTLVQPLGYIHRIADRRLKAITISGLIAAIATAALAAAAAAAAAAGRWVSAVAGTLATFAVIIFILIYTLIAKLGNAVLAATALADRVPARARELQARWDSAIDGRVALQTVALAALCVALAAA